METAPVERRAESGPIAIYLTPEEALVLDAFLASGRQSGDAYGTIEDQAELRVLWNLGAILESWLVPPLLPDYEEHLARARASVRYSTDLRLVWHVRSWGANDEHAGTPHAEGRRRLNEHLWAEWIAGPDEASWRRTRRTRRPMKAADLSAYCAGTQPDQGVR